MFGYVEGTLISKSEETNQCVIQAGPVGYEVLVHRATLDKLEMESETKLWLHTHAREDALILYGFEHQTEKQFFRLLMTVSGLGPKSVLSLLAQHGTTGLATLILEKDEKEISTAPGIGKKTAQRIVLELRSKVEKWQWVQQLETATIKPTKGQANKAPSIRHDLASALENLGYPTHQIRQTLDRVLEREEKKDFEPLLRIALKELTKVSFAANN